MLGKRNHLLTSGRLRLRQSPLGLDLSDLGKHVGGGLSVLDRGFDFAPVGAVELGILPLLQNSL